MEAQRQCSRLVTGCIRGSAHRLARPVRTARCETHHHQARLYAIAADICAAPTSPARMASTNTPTSSADGFAVAVLATLARHAPVLPSAGPASQQDINIHCWPPAPASKLQQSQSPVYPDAQKA